MVRKVICRSKTLRETDSRRFQMQGSIPCSPTKDMIKSLCNIYIKRKTRNLTRIPIFAMFMGEI